MAIYLGDIPLANTGYDKANTDLSNLKSTGKNIANWSNNITNCITEIPQDIKLEFANGTLTLKAGSRLYDGLGNSYTVPNDMSFSSASGSSTQQFMLIKSDLRGVGFVGLSDTNLSYNSTTGLLEYPNYGPWLLPVAITSHSGTTYTGIEQVFNGFGYVGNMMFSLPNIKGLIPNGRNADGSLNNIEFATSSVITRTFTTQSAEGILTLNCINDTYLSVRPNLSYDEASNQFINASSPNEAAVGVAKLVSGKVTYLAPKTSFHAVDYNDLKSLPNYNPTTTQTLKHVNGVLQWG